jgi:hypothetical protein
MNADQRRLRPNALSAFIRVYLRPNIVFNNLLGENWRGPTVERPVRADRRKNGTRLPGAEAGRGNREFDARGR